VPRRSGGIPCGGRGRLLAYSGCGERLLRYAVAILDWGESIVAGYTGTWASPRGMAGVCYS